MNRELTRLPSAAHSFAERHIGPQPDERDKMLAALGLDSVDALVDEAMPKSIRLSGPLDLPPALTETQALAELRGLAEANRPLTPMIGLGYAGTITPSVIRRNVLESPAWYTAYTPYQPEISQGRLEALLNFQTMVSDLTGLPIAGASLLDEATAVAEAMTLARRTTKTGTVLLLDADTLPQTIAVVQTRARALGLEVVVATGPLREAIATTDPFAVVVQTPGASGQVLETDELRAIADAAHEAGAEVIAACDLLACALLTPPGEWGADIAVGSSQRLGVPLFYGGPHAGFISVRQSLERSLPGRLVGVSKDTDGAQAYRLALQTREQHIRREKATSNICTAQVLLAVVGRHVRGLPRSARRTADRRSRSTTPPPAWPPNWPPAASRSSTSGSSTPCWSGCPAAPPRSSPPPGRAGCTCGGWMTTTSAISIGEDVTEAALGAVRQRAFGVEQAARPELVEGSIAAYGDLAGSERTTPVPDPPGVQHPPQRDGDAALPARPVGPRLRARSRHDPAGLVHHEAQRDHRDGADLVPGVRQPAPVRPGRGCAGLRHPGPYARGLAGRGDRLRPRVDPAERR